METQNITDTNQSPWKEDHSPLLRRKSNPGTLKPQRETNATEN